MFNVHELCVCFELERRAVVQLKRMSHTEYVALVFGAEAEAKSREVERARRAAREREHRRLTGGALLRHLLQRSVSAKRHEISGRLLTTGSRSPPCLLQHWAL